MSKVSLIENIITWQGEGPDTGKKMLLLRFKYCNRSCEWCDTKVKMRITEESEYKIENIQKQIDKEKCQVMLTGGEPTHLNHFNDTVNLLNKLNYNNANVETNGFNLIELISKIKKSKNVKYIYSPKIFSSHDLNIANNLLNQIEHNDNVFIKFVCEENNTFTEKFLDLLDSFNINDRVFIMPEGITHEELVKNSSFVFDMAEKYNFNISSRLHIHLNFI